MQKLGRWVTKKELCVKILKWLDKLEEILIASLMAVATLLTFVAIFHRNLSDIHLPWLQDILIKTNMSWAQELTIILFVWMAKLGAAYAVRTGMHVGVDVLVNQLKPANQKRCIFLSLLCGFLFTFSVAVLGVSLVWANFQNESMTDVLELPLWLVYLVIPVGSFLMAFRFVQVMFIFLRTGEVPKHEPAHVEGLDEERAV